MKFSSGGVSWPPPYWTIKLLEECKMKFELVVNGLVSIEAASRNVLNIRTEQRYGIDISKFDINVTEAVRKGFDVMYFRVKENKR